MTRNIRNRTGQGFYVSVGNAEDGYTGAMLPADLDYDPSDPEALPPLLAVADADVSPYLTLLVASGTVADDDTVAPLAVANLSATRTRDRTIRLAWTNPTDGDLRLVRVLRIEADDGEDLGDNPPTDFGDLLEAEGTVEVTQYLGTSAVPGANMTCDDVPPAYDTDYYYVVAVYDHNGQVTETLSFPGNVAEGLALDPPSKVTGLSVSTDEADGVTLEWTNPADENLASVRILRLEGTSKVPAIDSDGATTNSATVLATQAATPGAGDTYNDDTAEDGVVYTYATFTVDSDGLWNTAAVYASGKRDDPPSAVASFVASANVAGQINLSWTNPGELDLSLVRIVRAESPVEPAIDEEGAPTDGETIDTLVATPGAAMTLSDDTAEVGQTYIYAAFTRDAGGKWNTEGAQDPGEAYDPPAQISNFTALADTPTAGRIRTAWTNPTYPNLANVRLIIRTDHAPTSYDDTAGAVVVNSTDGGTPFSTDSEASIAYDTVAQAAGLQYLGVFTIGTNGLKQSTATNGLNRASVTNAP